RRWTSGSSWASDCASSARCCERARERKRRVWSPISLPSPCHACATVACVRWSTALSPWSARPRPTRPWSAAGRLGRSCCPWCEKPNKGHQGLQGQQRQENTGLGIIVLSLRSLLSLPSLLLGSVAQSPRRFGSERASCQPGRRHEREGATRASAYRGSLGGSHGDGAAQVGGGRGELVAYRHGHPLLALRHLERQRVEVVLAEGVEHFLAGDRERHLHLAHGRGAALAVLGGDQQAKPSLKGSSFVRMNDGELVEGDFEPDRHGPGARGLVQGLLSQLDRDLQGVVLNAVQQGRERAVHRFFHGRLVAVARAVADAQTRALHLHLDLVLPPVSVVGRRVAERVVAVEVLLHPRQLGAEIV